MCYVSHGSSPFEYVCIATPCLGSLLSKNNHFRHNPLYMLIFINFIYLVNFGTLSLSVFFRQNVISFYPISFLPGQA
ncbi:hypothetical protein CFF91_20825 [Salmonella enterica]|nr:hypothetical protein [Salmonella enterica]EDC7492070.1 hypothetical protein [Salmonella enterica]